jgi:hypothetical protein
MILSLLGGKKRSFSLEMIDYFVVGKKGEDESLELDLIGLSNSYLKESSLGQVFDCYKKLIVLLKKTDREPAFFEKKAIVVFDRDWFLDEPWDSVMWNIFFPTCVVNGRKNVKLVDREIEVYFERMFDSWLKKYEHKTTKEVLKK